MLHHSLKTNTMFMQIQERNYRSEESILVIRWVKVSQATNNGCFLVLHNYDFTDDSNASPILICKIRKGQELKAKCIAKKVGNFSFPSGSPHQLHRVSPKSMPSGLHVLLWLLNMTLTTSYGIRPIGLKPM